MRNLKRALSLALSTVMLVGMMAVGTSAASYADVDSADNVEAIEVMKAVSVMVGDENGNFNPDKNVTRAEMAVVMANLLDLQVEDFVGASIPFTDVPQWAHSFVAACYADGITGGISATQYGSNNSVTATQAALMLLKALGYFQYGSDFGTDWQVATIKQASNVGLFEGIDSARNAAMTRNEVAQIALNALESTLVEPDGTPGNITTSDGTVINLGSVTYKDRQSSNDKYKAISSEKGSDSDKFTMELGEDLFNGDLEKVAKQSDDFGRPAHVWEYKNDEIVTAADSADETYVVDDTKLTMGSILTDDDYFDYSKEDANVDSATYVLNGGDKDTKDTDLQKGDIVEVFEDDNGKVEKVVAIRYTAAKIDEVSTDLSNSEKKAGASYSIELVEVNNDSTSIGAGTYYDDYDKDSEILNGFSANTYEEGTVLAVALSAKDNRTILASYVADTATGTVSSYKANDYVTVDGTKYTMAGKVDGTSKDFSFEDEYNLYLTSDGYVIAVDGAAAANINDVYYITGVYMTKSTMGTEKYYAQAVALDGTVSEIELEKSEAGSGKIAEDVDAPDKLYTDVAGLYTLTDKANGNDKSGNDKFNAVEFKSNDNYTVKANGTLSASVAKDDTNMTVNGTKVYMNKDTNYIAVEKAGDDLDVSTAVGGMKCAKDDADKVLVISNKDDSRTAVYVLYIGDDLSSSVVSDEVVYVAEKSDEQNADGWVTTLYFMENNSSDDVTVETQVEPGFYYYDVDEDDVYSLEGVTGLGNDDVDDDTNGWDTLVINESSIYSTQNLLTKDNFSDIAFGSAKVIDSRDNIDSDKIYDKEITSVSNLKNAAKNGNITIRVYVTDGEITFIDVIGAGDGVKAPVIGTQPQDATVTAGSITGELTVAATGNDLTYQWYKDGAKISNETKATLTIPTDLTAGTYTFYVEVTSSKDGYTNTVKSTEVTVTVKPVAPVYSAGSVAGDVSDKTITITNSTNLPAGEYKLYKGDDTVLATVTLNDEGTALKFTKVEGLAESETQFQITVTINGVESDKSADIAITPVA